MKILVSIILFCAGTLTAGTVSFSPAVSPPVPGRNLFCRPAVKRPKIGVVLSGGGARGIAHIGALDALYRAGIPVDFIVGTSIGAAIGGLYAAGYTPGELETLGRDIDWSGLFTNEPIRSGLLATQGYRGDHFAEFTLKDGVPVLPTGYSGGQKLTTLLADLLLRARYRAGESFDGLGIPFRAVSTDLVTGKMVVHDSGNLSEVIRASMSVPLFFTPVEMGSSLLVDGGLVNCIPVDVARAMGADIVIAVDMAGLLRGRAGLNEPVAIADQVMSIMMKIPNRLQREKADIVVQPPVAAYQPADFSSYERLVAIGRESMAALIDSIRQVTVPAAGTDSMNVVIETLKIEGAGELADTVRAAAGLKVPGQVGALVLQRAADRVYGLGTVDSVTIEIHSGDSAAASVVVLKVHPRPRVSAIAVTGGTLFETEELTAPFGALVGGVLNTRICENAAAVLRSRYRSAGYTLMTVDDAVCDNGILRIGINEGRIAGINVEGNVFTADHVVLRAFPVHTGDIFNIERVMRGIRNLHGTGLFSYVNCTLTPEEGAYRVTVIIREKPSMSLRFGLRFTPPEGAAAFTELGNGNMFGSGITGSARILYGERRREAAVHMGTDRVGTSYFSGNAQLSYKYRDWNFNDIHTGDRLRTQREYWEGFVYAGSHIRRLGHTALGLRYVRQVNWLPGNTADDEIKGIRFRSMVNTFDRYPYPLAGKRNIFTIDAGQLLRNGELYVRTLMRLETVYRLGSRAHVQPRVILGASDSNVPFSEKFFVGGWAPAADGIALSGYEENELCGRNVMLTGVRVRYGLFRGLHASFSAAAGYVNNDVDFISNRLVFDWNQFQDTFAAALYAGAGGGLGILTPFGPVELGYGYGDRAAARHGRAYLRLGYIF